MKGIKLLKSCLIAIVGISSIVIAQDQNYYFYKPKIDYGSEGFYNPLSMMINGTYDILRNGAHSKDVFNQPYYTGMTNVWRNISNPLYNISNY